MDNAEPKKTDGKVVIPEATETKMAEVKSYGMTHTDRCLLKVVVAKVTGVCTKCPLSFQFGQSCKAFWYNFGQNCSYSNLKF